MVLGGRRGGMDEVKAPTHYATNLPILGPTDSADSVGERRGQSGLKSALIAV